MTKTKRYRSVSEVVHAVSENSQCAKDYDALAESRQIIRSLMALRAAKGLSQSDIAKVFGCSQSRISKLESGKDAGVSLGDLMTYAEAVGCDINLAFVDNTQPIVERVKHHAIRISRLMEQLVILAHADKDIARGVSGFFGEAFLNLLSILKRTGDALPRKEDGSPMVKIDIIGPVAIEKEAESQLLLKEERDSPEAVTA